MASLNKVEIIGHLGRDPESKFTAGGKQVVTFSVAATEKWQGGEHTEWFNVVAWEKLAENCARFIRKGSQVFIEGKLRTREYEGRDGTKRKTTEVIAHNVIFLSNSQGQASVKPPEYRQEAATSFDGGITDADVPF